MNYTTIKARKFVWKKILITDNNKTMKTISLFCLTVLICLGSLPAEAQKKAKVQTLSAIKLKKEALPDYLENPELGVYTIDREGVLRAVKGYKIILDRANKRLQVMPEKWKYIAGRQTNDYDDIELPSGDLAICWCGEGSDNCRFKPQADHREFHCTGSCSCGVSVIFNDFKTPVEYQSINGEWFNL